MWAEPCVYPHDKVRSSGHDLERPAHGFLAEDACRQLSCQGRDTASPASAAFRRVRARSAALRPLTFSSS